MPDVRLIGTYEVAVPDETARWITQNVTGDSQATREELSGLALMEIEVRDDSGDFDVGLLQQSSSDQVPWLERYFSANGLELLGEEKPLIAHYRVCFFLHYFDPNEVIVSPYGTIIPGQRSPLPERLREVCAYEHPG